MPRKPRLIDLFGPDKPKRMSRRRRALITHDGTMIVQGESYPIAGEAIAMDARPHPDLRSVTFDGAIPSTTRKEHR